MPRVSLIATPVDSAKRVTRVDQGISATGSQALYIDPRSGSASLGYALALARPPGDLAAAESVLREALRRKDSDCPRWRLLLALARLLIQRGDAAQRREFYLDALSQAQEAIGHASAEPETHYIAAIAQYKVGASREGRHRPVLLYKAVRHLRRCLELDCTHAEAMHTLQILEEDLRTLRASLYGSVLLVALPTSLLVTLWAAFFLSAKVTSLMLTTLTPVMVALTVVGLLLPYLIHLKLPGGVEADLSTSITQVSAGPTGDVVLSPGYFTASARHLSASQGPTGQVRRLGR